MTDDFEDFELRGLWQRSNAALAPLGLDEIKRRASRLGNVVERRNRIEYGAAAFVIVCFALYAIVLPGWMFKVGSLAVIAGILVVVWQLSRRTSRSDPSAEATDIRAHYRARLVREEHMLARVGRWYLAPLIPGLLIFMSAQAIAAGKATPAGFALYAGLPLLLFGGIWLLNRRAAAMLRTQIDRLDRSPSKGDSA